MIGVFFVVVAAILAVVYFRHFLSYPRDFKLLQVASCADLSRELTSQRHPIVVESSQRPIDCAVSPWHPVVVRARSSDSGDSGDGAAWVHVYHPDDGDEYLRVELDAGSALMVPWRWRYEVSQGAEAHKAWSLWCDKLWKSA